MTHSPLVQSAGVIVVQNATAGREARFLLLRAYRNWDFPKGVVAPGEGEEDAALREMEEETGLPRSAVSRPWGTASFQTSPYATRHAGRAARKQTRYYLAALRDTAHAIRTSAEHQEARWMAYDEAQAKLAERLRPVLAWAMGLIGRLGFFEGIPAGRLTTESQQLLRETDDSGERSDSDSFDSDY